MDTATGAWKPGGAAGPAVRRSPHGDGPGATGTERGRAGDADRVAGASPGDPDLEVRRPDRGATPAARRPAVHPVPAGIGRHMAEVERGWFRQVFLGADVPD